VGAATTLAVFWVFHQLQNPGIHVNVGGVWGEGLRYLFGGLVGRAGMPMASLTPSPDSS
jgi:hypothetical protein